MMDMVVVGAGLAGKWLTLAAQRAGHSVAVIDDGQPSAEIAALAMLRPSWLPKEERHLLRPSLDLWETVGEVITGAAVTSYQHDELKRQEDWFAIAPKLPTVEPDHVIHDRAVPLDDSEGKAVWTEKHGVIEADAVVWCDGAGEGRRTYGCTWVNDNPAAVAAGLHVHHVAPYKVLAAVGFERQARLGSSSAATMEKALEQADKFLQIAIDRGMIHHDVGHWYRVDGVRLKRDEYLTRDGSGWRWSGFHRNGYGLVPALADGVVEAVEML